MCAYCWNSPWRQCPASRDCFLWNEPLPHPSHGPRTPYRLVLQENWNTHCDYYTTLNKSRVPKERITHLYPMSSKPLSCICNLWMLISWSLHSVRLLQLGNAVWCMMTRWAEPFSRSFCWGAAAPHCGLETIFTEKQFDDQYLVSVTI